MQRANVRRVTRFQHDTQSKLLLSRIRVGAILVCISFFAQRANAIFIDSISPGFFDKQILKGPYGLSLKDIILEIPFSHFWPNERKYCPYNLCVPLNNSIPLSETHRIFTQSDST